MAQHGGMDGSSMPNKPNHRKMMMHMTFYWGKDAFILFSGWPGHRLGMYILSLFFVFALSVLVEFLYSSRLIKPGSNRVLSGLTQTALHTLRIGLAFLVMLAVMSFNVGELIAAVLGHALGFLLFSSRVFNRSEPGHPSQNRRADLHC